MEFSSRILMPDSELPALTGRRLSFLLFIEDRVPVFPVLLLISGPSFAAFSCHLSALSIEIELASVFKKRTLI